MKARSEILGIERRRKWTPAEKAQFLEEALQPGVTVASVADKHGISRGLFYYWMAKARAGLLPGVTLTACQYRGLFRSGWRKRICPPIPSRCHRRQPHLHGQALVSSRSCLAMAGF